MQTYSVELDRGLNLLPLIFFLLPPTLPEKDGLQRDLNVNQSRLMFKDMVFQVGVIHNQHRPEHRPLELCPTLPKCLVHWCYRTPSFPIQEKRNELIINALFSTGRRAQELTEKIKSLQPGTTEYGIWVMWAVGFRMPPYIPCQELLRGRPFSQMSEICFVSGILSLQEWESPFDLKLKMCIYIVQKYNQMNV